MKRLCSVLLISVSMIACQLPEQQATQEAPSQKEWSIAIHGGAGYVPEDIPEVTVPKETTLIEAVTKSGLVDSKSEFKRVVAEGGVKNTTTDEAITEFSHPITEELIIKIGKKKFLKIRI